MLSGAGGDDGPREPAAAPRPRVRAVVFGRRDVVGEARGRAEEERAVEVDGPLAARVRVGRVEVERRVVREAEARREDARGDGGGEAAARRERADEDDRRRVGRAAPAQEPQRAPGEGVARDGDHEPDERGDGQRADRAAAGDQRAEHARDVH